VRQHLPREYANPAPGPDLPYCHFCDTTVHRDDEEQVSEAEPRWQHICHYICDCPDIPDAVHACHSFRTAMSELALQFDVQRDMPLSALDAYHTEERRALMACLLDPVSMCASSPHALPMCTHRV
jgi:hypothetical protein